MTITINKSINKYDVVIIGAGIIGLSTALKLLEQKPDLKLCILEKENEVAKHQTGHNSGIIHSGIYYKPGSLKAVNCIKGYNLLLKFCDENNIPYDICGKIIVATNEKEFSALYTLYDRGKANGLDGVKIISREEIKEREPYINGMKGIFVPQTGIVDYKLVSKKIVELLISKGVVINFNEKVEDIKIKNNEVKIITDKESYQTSLVVACAGLQSDKIASLTNGKINFRIIPFRGEYYKLKESSNYFVKNLIYPVPDPEFPFLGVHFTRKIDGVVEAGPNAVLVLKKEGYKKSDFKFRDAIDTLSYKGFYKIAFKYWKTGAYEIYRSLSKKEFVNSLQKFIPEIKEDDLIPGGSGVRAQACDRNGNLIDDFLFIENKRVINVCNAPSPGATSSLSIGETIVEKVLSRLTD